MMTNVNIGDKFFVAVEEYNTTITDPKRQYQFSKFSYDEKKGIFYNCLRRQLNFGNCYRNPYSPALRMEDFEITLDEINRIIGFEVKRRYACAKWSGVLFHDERNDTINELKRLGEQHKIIYPTAGLNEMARIVNQLKL